MARKSRLPRLNFAKWASSSLYITPRDWDEMAVALGRELSSEHRGEISKIAAHYLAMEGMERAAPFAHDEEEWLATLRKVAADLHDVAVRTPAQSRPARSGLVEVQTKLDGMLTAACGRSFSIEQFALFLIPAIEAAINPPRPSPEIEEAMRRLLPPNTGVDPSAYQRPPGIEEGRQWRALIAALDAKFREYGLPNGIRKDSGGKSKSDEQSPFVSFVWRLQQTFPVDARRHTQSLPALAVAMADARREISPSKQRRSKPAA